MLVDTSGMIAVLNDREPAHAAVMACLSATTEPLYVPVTVLPEIDYMVSKYLGVRAAIGCFESISAEEFQLTAVLGTDLPRILELMRQYADANIGLVDASLVAVAERLGVRRILTLDRRHFGPIRPRHCPAFEILP